MNVLLLTICLLSLVLNFYFLILPAINRKLRREKTIEFQNLNDIQETIVNAGLKMLTSEKVYMSFSEEEGFYAFLSKVKSKLKGNKNEYSYFNFPRAFLMDGLLDKYLVSKDNTIYTTVKDEVSKIIDDSGKLKFEFNKIDQSLFGLVLLKMYQIEKEDKYLTALANIEKEIRQFINPKGLVRYRTKNSVLFVDTLGMICPFLYSYGSFQNREDLIHLANTQIKWYIDNGFDNENVLPFHAIDPANKLRLGPTNWGRGIGWFMLGLSYSLKYSNSINNPFYTLFEKTFETINHKLENLKVRNSYWPQFIGQTNDVAIDSSVTFMLYYSTILSGRTQTMALTLKVFESILKLTVNEEGFVINCSGDTMYINRYATKKTKSELVQGIVLSLITKI